MVSTTQSRLEGSAVVRRAGLWSLIQGDLREKAGWVYGDTSRRGLLKALASDGTLAMILYRLMQASQRRRLVPFSMVFNKLNGFCGGCVIGRGADFGPGFVLVHSSGVVINGAVRGGRNVKIEHQVTIGAERFQSPVLGDDIFIGAGAKIVGGVSIGSRTKIGANAVVLSDIPDGATAVGVPARVICPKI
jgi:serine O-acetyltransferase